MFHPDIPSQIKGGFHDTVSMHCMDTVDFAMDCYEKLGARLRSGTDIAHSLPIVSESPMW